MFFLSNPTVEPPVDRDSDRWAMVDQNVYSLDELKVIFKSFIANSKEFCALLLEIRSHVPIVFYSCSIAIFSALFYLTILVPSSMLVYIIRKCTYLTLILTLSNPFPLYILTHI